jgi:hypothetical protein
MKPKSLFATLKSLVAELLLWSFFVVGTAASIGADAVLDGPDKNVATFTGAAVSLLTGTRIAKKPGIKAFLSTRPPRWAWSRWERSEDW